MVQSAAGQEVRPVHSAVTSAASMTPWRSMRPVQSIRQSIPGEDSDDSSSSSGDEEERQIARASSVGSEEEGAEEDYFAQQRSMPPMVWDNDRPEDHGITSTEATMSIITAIIGAGIMALPQLPKSGGLVVCVALMVVSAFATVEAGSAFFRSTMANNIVASRGLKLSSTYIHTYDDFGHAAYGPAGETLIRVLLVIWFLGVCCGYVILMGQNVQNILEPLVHLDYRVWVLILTPALLFLAMLRDMSAVAKLMPLGVGSAIASCILIMSKGIMDRGVWEDWPEQDLKSLHSIWPSGDLMSLGSLTATIFGALSCMGNVPAIMDEMRNKHRLMRSFRTGLGIVTLLYIGIMVIGYNAYGNFIQPNIVDSMKYHPATWEEAQNEKPRDWTGHRSDIIPTAMSCCVVVNLIISYPLLLAPVFLALQGTAYGKDNLKVGSKMNYMMRILIVIFTVAVPLVITEFSLVFNLFASICGPTNGVIFPICFGCTIRRKIKAKGSGPIRLVWQGALLLLSGFCIVFGLIGSMQDLIGSFS